MQCKMSFCQHLKLNVPSFWIVNPSWTIHLKKKKCWGVFHKTHFDPKIRYCVIELRLGLHLGNLPLPVSLMSRCTPRHLLCFLRLLGIWCSMTLGSLSPGSRWQSPMTDPWERTVYLPRWIWLSCMVNVGKCLQIYHTWILCGHCDTNPNLMH